MSEEDVELARRGYELFNRGDREAWLAVLDPDVELVLPFFQQLEGGGPARGRAGAEQLWDSWHKAFPDASFDVDSIRDLGDKALVTLRVRGHGAGSDVPIEQSSWHVMSWRNGKLLRLRAFLREAEALEAAGLSE